LLKEGLNVKKLLIHCDSEGLKNPLDYLILLGFTGLRKCLADGLFKLTSGQDECSLPRLDDCVGYVRCKPLFSKSLKNLGKF
jgi:hypothetical protein